MSVNGFVLWDKKSGETSFDVVRQVRKLFGVKKVGHTGTLDPLATGLLIVAVGEATKLIEYMMADSKEYEVVAHFGFVSDSFDADGVISEVSAEVVSRSEIEKAIVANFLGEISQVPPKFSALKIEGKRAYDLARAGTDFEMKARKVLIKEFEVLDFDWPRVGFRVSCGSGTYIRSLVHDLGQVLGVGAYVQELRRTMVGDFSVREASENLIEVGDFAAKFLALFEVSEEELKDLRDGKVVSFGREVPELGLAVFCGKVVGVIGAVFPEVSSASLSENFDPHVPVSTLRSKFSFRLPSNTSGKAGNQIGKFKKTLWI